MSIRWRCPGCGVEAVSDEGQPGPSIGCGDCGLEMPRAEALCVVCDGADALKPRDSIHVQCVTCGESQMVWAPARAAR